MSRICPTCESQSVPWARLLLVHRTTCKNCNERLGLHWLFAAVLYTVIFTTFFIAALWVQARFSLFEAAAILVSMFVIIGATAARFGPLEPKPKWRPPRGDSRH